MKGLQNVRAYVRGRGIIHTDVGVENGRISLLGQENGAQLAPLLSLPSDALVLPGFVDEHIHGAAGADAMDATPKAIETISMAVAEEGTTSFVATTMTQSRERISAALNNIRLCMERGTSGARLLGAHLEGPFIESAFRGAQKEEFVALPTLSEFEAYRELSGDNIRIVTLSPHAEGALEFIRCLVQNKITASVGHSGTDYECVMAAAEAGLSSVSHTFNAQSGVHHRKFGVAGAALLDDRLFTELICDGIHVCEPAMRLLAKCKPSDRLVLVTDAIRAKGIGDGESELGGQRVTVKGGEARLDDGTLAGSVLRMNDAIRNLVEMVGVSLENAVDAATYNPAKNLGLDEEIGSIALGKRADLTVVNEKFEVLATVVGGNVVYKKG